jgi:chromosome partitioning protein
MFRIAIANQKGGVGKTTTAVNLGAALAEAGRRVVLIDLDPAASATDWLGARPGPGLAEVLTDDGRQLAELLTPTALEGLELVPASPTLVGADRALAGEPGAETILARAVDRLSPGPDLVLIDTPPTLGILTISALVGAPAVLVPVQARALSLAGLAALTRTVERVAERLEPSCRLVGILPGELNRTRLAAEVVGSLRQHFGPLVLEASISASVRLAEAPSHRQWIGVYDPTGRTAAEFRALAAELWQRLNTNVTNTNVTHTNNVNGNVDISEAM